MVAQLDSLYVRKRPLKAVTRLMSYALFEGRPVTTRGQWINWLVFALFEVEKRLPQLRHVKKPVFIIGTGRSGTTILGVVLSMHKAVGFLNEPKALWHSIYPFEDVIGSYSRGEARFRLTEGDATEEVVRRAHRIFGAYLATTQATRVVDKYPELVFRVPFVLEIFPDARFIFLVRNGWDTCHSIESWSRRLGVQKDGEVHDWWGVDRRKWRLMLEELISADDLLSQDLKIIESLSSHVDMAAVEWIVTMREGLHAAARYPDKIVTVRYEDIVARPAEKLTELLDFCELPEDETFMEYAESVLRPTQMRATFTLSQAIVPAFKSTMSRLGY